MDDLLSAQKRLGRTLERASIGEDRELAGAVREKGEAFANLLHGTMRMTRLYDANNETLNKPAAELHKLLGWLVQHLGVVHVVTVDDQVYVNDVRIRFNLQRGTGNQLGGELRRHNIGSMSFQSGLADKQILDLCRCLASEPAPAEKRAAICAALADKGVGGLEVGGLNRYLDVGEELPSSEWSEVLRRTAELCEETWDNVATGRLFNPLALRRAVVELLAAGIDTEGLWVPIDKTSEHGSHAVRVCRLALAVASGVGFDERTLQDIGVAALVHDIGYAAPGPWAGPNRSSFREHIGGGALVMIRQKGFHAAKIHRILGILYHHHNYKDIKDVPSLFGRVLHLCEDYDNLCGSRGGHTPPAAIAAMLSGAGSVYDPVLLQVLVNRLGRYPTDTRVQLGDGRAGRCLGLARPGHFEHPRVAVGAGVMVDLAEGGKVARVLED
jgi:hypothetical protein